MTKITEPYSTVIPAYSRDYKSGKDAKADFLAGKDFNLQTYNASGYCSVRDFASGCTVNIRYKRLTQIAVVRVP